MTSRTTQILQELGKLYEQQKRFVAPSPADEPVVVSVSDLDEYFKRSERIRQLNRELPEAIQKESGNEPGSPNSR